VGALLDNDLLYFCLLGCSDVSKLLLVSCCSTAIWTGEETCGEAGSVIKGGSIEAMRGRAEGAGGGTHDETGADWAILVLRSCERGGAARWIEMGRAIAIEAVTEKEDKDESSWELDFAGRMTRRWDEMKNSEKNRWCVRN